MRLSYKKERPKKGRPHAVSLYRLRSDFLFIGKKGYTYAIVSYKKDYSSQNA